MTWGSVKNGNTDPEEQIAIEEGDGAVGRSGHNSFDQGLTIRHGGRLVVSVLIVVNHLLGRHQIRTHLLLRGVHPRDSVSHQITAIQSLIVKRRVLNRASEETPISPPHNLLLNAKGPGVLPPDRRFLETVVEIVSLVDAEEDGIEALLIKIEDVFGVVVDFRLVGRDEAVVIKISVDSGLHHDENSRSPRSVAEGGGGEGGSILLGVNLEVRQMMITVIGILSPGRHPATLAVPGIRGYLHPLVPRGARQDELVHERLLLRGQLLGLRLGLCLDVDLELGLDLGLYRHATRHQASTQIGKLICKENIRRRVVGNVHDLQELIRHENGRRLGLPISVLLITHTGELTLYFMRICRKTNA